SLGGFQFVDALSWIPAINSSYHVGLDGLSLSLVTLTSLLGLIAVLASRHITSQPKAFFAWLLLLQSCIIGVFSSLDLLLFFIFWELEVIPLYFLISTWGSNRKERSAIKYVLYTLFGSAFMLAGIVALYFTAGTFSLPELYNTDFAMLANGIPLAAMFFLLLAGFAVKLPIFPFHTWLPDTYSDAPTAGSIMLAGALSKMGGYGIARICLGLFPDTAASFSSLFMGLAVVNIIYGGAIALRQKEIKRIIAYSSFSHMGFVLLGIFSLNEIGLTGAALQMVSHGLIIGLLFAGAAILVKRTGTSRIDEMGGLARQMPVLCGLVFVAAIGAMGVPSSSGFVAEVSVYLGAFSASAEAAKIITIISLVGILLAASYMLNMVMKVFFGPVRESFASLPDIGSVEKLYLGVLATGIFTVGLYPQLITTVLKPAIKGLAVLWGG
ncbi:MAG: NADH-quinone oxidoreductase subunit M, partial [Dehalococcoidales bacterium]|nr:NADH-quinone oxidoreductase subunit M [Dehalococcoidales bacterium]